MNRKINTQKLRTLRNSKSWTQGELAEKAKITSRTLQRLESTGNSSPRTLRLIATALGVPPGSLLDESRSSQLPPNLKVGAIVLVAWGAILVLLTVLEVVLQPVLESYYQKEVETGFGLSLYLGILAIFCGIRIFSMSRTARDIALLAYWAIAIHSSLAVIRLIASFFELGPIYSEQYSQAQISAMSPGITIFLALLLPMTVFFYYQCFLLSNSNTKELFQ